ncbi:MAG: PAS domain-containing sensor histidine kinase [Chitinophagaceae bacterium]
MKETAFEMFTFFEKTPALVCIAGKDGFLRKVNPSVIQKFGYTEAELYSQPISSFIHLEDKAMTEEERGRLLEGKALMNFQNRYVKKNGETMWLEWTSIYFPEKEVVFAIAHDITARKQIEKEVEEKFTKFKSLATHFKSKIEKERKYLAIELHEEMAQLAAVVKMDIDIINDYVGATDPKIKSRLDHALAVTDLLINTIRRISFSISPKMLDELGLDETLKWHCDEFSMLNGIPCRFKSDYDEAMLTQEVKLDFFRICQEGLSNVMYHAQADNAEISIEDIGTKIRLTVADDGKGFDMKEQKPLPGLTSMRERAASINGEITIWSKPGEGTRIAVEVAK